MVISWLSAVVVQVVINAPSGTSGAGGSPATSISRTRQWLPPPSRKPEAVTLTW